MTSIFTGYVGILVWKRTNGLIASLLMPLRVRSYKWMKATR